MKYLSLIFSIFVTLASSWAHAAADVYQCYVLSDAYIRQDGTLDVFKESPRIGQAFAVIKKTGELVGDVMDPLKNPKVLSMGGEKNSYKVIWNQKATGTNGVFLDYLNVDEFVKGTKKPFGFFSGSLLLSGYCE